MELESYQKQHTPKLSGNCLYLLKANMSPSVVPVCLPARSGPELHWCYTGNGWSSGSFHLRYSRNRQPGTPSLLWQLYRLNEETEKTSKREVNTTTATGWLTKATLQMGIISKKGKLSVCCLEAVFKVAYYRVCWTDHCYRDHFWLAFFYLLWRIIYH